MQIHADHELEKSEVEAVLASGIFNRAPNLIHILTYVCSRYFEGSAEEIKEYNIAVEALGRSSGFDQKKDSIVRVEAHRLRKRLREYYENEGSDHVVQIEIPPGQYAPRFVVRKTSETDSPPGLPVQYPAKQLCLETTEPDVNLITTGNAEVLTPAIEPVGIRRGKRWLAAAALAIGAILVAALVTFSLVRRVPIQSRKELPSVLAGDEIRILAGVVDNESEGVDNSKYTDEFSHTWNSDRFFSGGSLIQSAGVHPITGTRDPHLYQSRREGNFSYDIPLSPGVYELHLYFAETLYGDNNIAGGGETSRIFRVSANGNALLTDFDVIEDVGPSAADVKIFKDISPASDGKLHLKFEAGTNPAFVNGIEIVPGIAGRMHPVRMVARTRGFDDKSGHFWDSDRYVKGGQLVVRNEPVAETSDPELYHGERFGNITYTIPVARPGRYCLTLYFVETWFGPGRPGGGGERSRIFDILCNGVALRRNFDIFKEAGGQNRALTLSFHNLEPTPQAKLVISLVPARNYASINALEIEDESTR